MKKGLLVLFLGLIVSLAFCQTGAHDPAFNVHDDGSRGDGTSGGFINSVLHTATNKVVIAGNFNGFNGHNSPKVARLLPSGEVDKTFTAGHINGAGPNKIVELPTGKIIAVGSVSSTFNNTKGIVRLNQNGSIDPGLNALGFGFNNPPTSVAVQSDGKLIVGGGYTMFNTFQRNSLVRLNPNGDLDTSFYTELPVGSLIEAIQVALDGKIYIGGSFSNVDGFTTHNLARLHPNGRVDSSFVSNVQTTPKFVKDIKLMANQKILVSGGNVISSYLKKLTEDGTPNNSFNPIDTNLMLSQIDIHSDSTITVLWTRTNFLHNKYSESGLFRVKLDGTIDFSIDSLSTFTKGYVNCFSRDGLGNYAVGGSFEFVNNKFNPFLAKLHFDGIYDPYFNRGTGFNGFIKAIAQLSDEKLLAAGQFRYFNLVDVQNFVKLRRDGTLEPEFFHGDSLNGHINSILVLPDEKILLAGDFTHYNGYKCGRIVRLFPTGLIDSSFNVGSGFSKEVSHMSLLPSNKIVVSGHFDSLNGQLARNIVLLNPNGSRDPQFVAGVQHPNQVLFNVHELQSDGKILVGGTWWDTTGNKGFVNRLNSDGSFDPTFMNGQVILNNSVQALYQQADGKILVGGDFTGDTINPNRGLTRFNANGLLDASFSISGLNATNTVDITMDDVGRILIAGGDKYLNALSSNGSVDTSFNVGSGFIGQVNKLFIQSDKKIIAGGAFGSYRGIPRNRVCRILNDDICIGAAALKVSDITHNSAIIKWNEYGGALEWHYDYGPVPHTPSLASMMGPIIDSTDTLWNLNSNTDYEYWVRSTCGSGYYSDWAGPYPFRTHENPNIHVIENQLEENRFWFYENKLFFSFDQSQKIEVEVFDIAGRSVYKNQSIELQEREVLWMDLPIAMAGVYLVQLKTKEGYKHLKFSKF